MSSAATHTVVRDPVARELLYCLFPGCLFDSYDLGEVAAHVVRHQPDLTAPNAVPLQADAKRAGWSPKGVSK